VQRLLRDPKVQALGEEKDGDRRVAFFRLTPRRAAN
jgi:hypothetical protein